MNSLFQNETWKWVEDELFTFPQFPLLWTSHCVMMALALRATFGANRWKSFSRQHPLSCYLLAIVYTFPGGITSNILLAEPPFSFLLNAPFMLSMTLAWYLVFYCPFDLFATMIDLFYLRLPLGAFQDVLRIHLVLAGVDLIQNSHPGTIFYPVFFAVCKSSGFMFVKYAESILLSGGLQRAFILPHHSTKTCLVAAAVFAARGAGFIDLGVKTIFGIFAICMVLSRVFMTVSDADPYYIFEKTICYFVFGGVEEGVTKQEKGVAKQEKAKGGKKKAE